MAHMARGYSMQVSTEETTSADAFLASMPESYRSVYSPAETEEHAAICARRGRHPAHVELWRSSPPGGAILCVVADDHPGLLSIVSAALHLHELDVTTAQIYCRQRPDGVPEAVDFFWVRPIDARSGQIIEPDEIASVARLLGDLVVRQACPDPILSPRQAAGHFDTTPLARAFFETQSLRGGKYVLVVEALDYPGLLLRVARTLHGQGLDIVASDIRTEGARVRDRFTVRDTHGARLVPDRLAAIRAAVVEAVRNGST
jgi:UTP:GlnB (protein PII) uridylyltransferase